MSSQGGCNIKIFEDAEGVARAATDMIVTHLGHAARAKGFCSMALSGGSTPRGLFELLVTDPGLFGKMPWQETHFFWGDERHVPPGHAHSNYRMAMESMLSKAPVPRANIHRVRGEAVDACRAAAEYEKELQRFFGAPRGQFPRFDLALMGMGPDGHTASLFPGTAALGETRRWVVSNWVDAFSAHRITMTVPVFNHAALVIFLVCGGAKADALRAVLASDGFSQRFPARLIRPAAGDLIWLADRAAAAQLGPTGMGSKIRE